MYAVLAPAKTFDLAPTPAHLPVTQPALLDDARLLVDAAKALDERKVARLMKTSSDVARRTCADFEAISLPFTADNARPAALAFAGDVYHGLQARSFTRADMEWSQDRLGILSGMFGVLRPLDLVQPHRLEMGIAMPTPRGRNLYSFWSDRIARFIAGQVAGHRDRALVHLASNEYLKAVPLSALRTRVIRPVFEEVEGQRARSIVVHAKKARGAMARFIVQRRIETAEQLKGFNLDGYRYDATVSKGDQMVFRRPFRTVSRRSR